jgi:hypothetical protein
MFTTADAFKDISCITHGFFTRQGGVSEGQFASLNCGWKSGDDVHRVAENRGRIAAVMRVSPEKLLSCHQIHSATVATVTTIWNSVERPEADAMVTQVPGIALGILTADCVPVLFVDPVARVIGAAHAGWRGALGGIVENTIVAMKNLGAKTGNIQAALGPCIWQDTYEVDAEFPKAFLAQDPTAKRFFKPAARVGHLMFDLPGYVTAKLSSAGITQIVPSPANTFDHHEQYFSYRRNTLQGIKGTGSLMSAIALLPE